MFLNVISSDHMIKRKAMLTKTHCKRHRGRHSDSDCSVDNDSMKNNSMDNNSLDNDNSSPGKCISHSRGELDRT